MTETAHTTVITRSEAIRPDSIEIGTPGKTGAVKVFFDSGDAEDARTRILKAVELLALAREAIREGR